MIVASSYRITPLPSSTFTQVSNQGAVLTSTYNRKTESVAYDVPSTTINAKTGTTMLGVKIASSSSSGTTTKLGTTIGTYKPTGNTTYFQVTSSLPVPTTTSSGSWTSAQTTIVKSGTVYNSPVSSSSTCYTCGTR